MSDLQLRLFGDFVATYQGQPIRKFRTTKAQALLAYLAVENQQPHTREQIFDLLWPGLPTASARTNLRQITYQLRKVIPSLVSKQQGAEVPLLLSDHGAIQLNPAADITTDVVLFEAQLATVYQHAHRDIVSCTTCFESLLSAVALYQGRFLAGVHVADSNTYEDWLLVQREALQRKFLDALGIIGRIHLAHGRYGDAEQVARQQLAIDEFREAAHRQLLEALARSGQRSAAIAHYEKLQTLLKAELGMTPSHKTMQLAQAIADDELDLMVAQSVPVRGYELLEQVGAGSFGVVHRAYQPLVGREVAVKIIKAEYANRPNFIRRFEYEAQTIARLEHPHIVPLYDYWREPDRAYLVMRYLRGGTLRQSLAQGMWSAERAATLIGQISSALATAHQQNIIHRDVNPNNIMLDEDGNGYLSDFGIAREQGTIAQHTDSSPTYLSPEQRRNEPLSPRTDIYGLGMLLRETLGPAISPALSAIIEQATAPDPADRFADVLTFAEAVQQAVADEDVEDAPLPVLVTDNPYKGLRAFQEGDAGVFFGRSELTNQLITHFSGGSAGILSAKSDQDGRAPGRFLAVVGPSGSGKSSVVKAGLLPKLRAGAVAGSENWYITEMVPSTHPLEELEAALLHVAVDPPASLLEPLQKDARGLVRVLKRILPPTDPDGQLLLVIDQFEELFTLVESDARRQHFLNILLTALDAARSQLRVVITLRADFFHAPLQQPQLAAWLQANTVVVLPLTPFELEEAITQPAALAGVRFAPALVKRIIADVSDQIGMLPLLQYALTELFEQRDAEQNVISLAAYEETGGILGALGQRAEEIYGGFSAETQALTRQLFLRLVALGEGVEDTRRRVRVSELEQLTVSSEQLAVNSKDDPSSVHHSPFTIHRLPLSAFGNARLLSFDRDPATREPTVEVAHEALLREWGRLRGWLDESRADVQLQRMVGRDSAEWIAADRDPAYLLRGSRLEQFEGWADNATVALTADEQQFLTASIDARTTHHATEESRQQRELAQAQQLAATERRRAEEQTAAAGRLRQRAMLLAGAMAVATVLAVAAVIFGQRATTNANLAATRQVEAQDNADLAMTAEAGAILERENAETQTRLTRSRELALASLNVADDDTEASLLLALAAMDVTYTKEAEEALHRAMQTPSVLHRLNGSGDFFRIMQYSPDGTKLAAVSWRDSGDQQTGTLFVWDVMTGRELFVTEGLGTEAVTLDFSPDGQLIAVGVEDENSDELVKFVDSNSGAVVRSLAVFPLETLSQYDPAAGQPPPLVSHVDFSPDGKRLITNQYDTLTISSIVWDIESREPLFSLPNAGFDEVHPLYVSHYKRQTHPNFSPDGQFIAGGIQFDALLWDALTGSTLMTVTHTTSEDSRIEIVDSGFSADGNSWLTKAENGVIKLWDIETGSLIRERDTGSLFGGFDLSRDGTLLITSTGSGNPLVMSADLRTEIRTLVDEVGHQANVVFGLNNTQVATHGENGTLIVWDMSQPKEVATFEQAHTFGGAAIAFDPTGNLLASGAAEGHIQIWDMQSGEQLHQLQSSGWWITHMMFSPDGRQLLTVGAATEGEIWDVASGELLTTLEGHETAIFQARYSPDGRLIATTGNEGGARVWDSVTGESLLTFPVEQVMQGVAFSPDSSKVVFTYEYDSLPPAIYDIASAEEIQALESEVESIFHIHYTSDGERLVGGSYRTGHIYVWDSETGQEIRRIDTGRLTRSSVLLSDNRRFAVGTTDGTIDIWDIETGEKLRTLFDGQGNRQIVTVSPDEQYIAAIGFQDGIVRVFTLDMDELTALAQARLTRTFKPTECAQYRIEPCPTVTE